MQTLDMRFIRYLNLFEKITRARCKNCFFYNDYLIFAVSPAFISRAIGEGGRNVRRISELIGKRVKIIAIPRNTRDIRNFISIIVSPIRFNSLQIEGDEIIINSNKQSKASLIGRNKVRFQELSKIIEEFFGKKLRIV